MEVHEMNTIEELNKVFDRQISRDIVHRKRHLIEKQLFNLTLHFSIADWRIIQSKKYFEKRLSMTELECKEYTLICVKYYINNFK